MLHLRNVTFMTADPERLADFWASALGFSQRSEGGGQVLIANDGWTHPRFTFQPIDASHGPRANAVHVDLTATDRAAEVDRLVALGASADRDVTETEPGGMTWTVMRDPDGNEFCVAQDPTAATESPSP